MLEKIKHFVRFFFADQLYIGNNGTDSYLP